MPDKDLIYPIFRPFQTDEHARFGGRDYESGQLEYLLLKNRFVVLHGAAGTGKSSVLQAGLFPRLLGLRENSKRTIAHIIHLTCEPGLSIGALTANNTADSRGGETARIIIERFVQRCSRAGYRCFDVRTPRDPVPRQHNGPAQHTGPVDLSLFRVLVVFDSFENAIQAVRGSKISVSDLIRNTSALIDELNESWSQWCQDRELPYHVSAVFVSRNRFMGELLKHRAVMPGYVNSTVSLEFLNPRSAIDSFRAITLLPEDVADNRLLKLLEWTHLYQQGDEKEKAVFPTYFMPFLAQAVQERQKGNQGVAADWTHWDQEVWKDLASHVLDHYLDDAFTEASVAMPSVTDDGNETLMIKRGLYIWVAFLMKRTRSLTAGSQGATAPFMLVTEDAAKLKEYFSSASDNEQAAAHRLSRLEQGLSCLVTRGVLQGFDHQDKKQYRISHSQLVQPLEDALRRFVATESSRLVSRLPQLVDYLRSGYFEMAVNCSEERPYKKDENLYSCEEQFQQVWKAKWEAKQTLDKTTQDLFKAEEKLNASSSDLTKAKVELSYAREQLSKTRKARYNVFLSLVGLLVTIALASIVLWYLFAQIETIKKDVQDARADADVKVQEAKTAADVKVQEAQTAADVKVQTAQADADVKVQTAQADATMAISQNEVFIKRGAILPDLTVTINQHSTAQKMADFIKAWVKPVVNSDHANLKENIPLHDAEFMMMRPFASLEQLLPVGVTKQPHFPLFTTSKDGKATPLIWWARNDNHPSWVSPGSQKPFQKPQGAQEDLKRAGPIAFMPGADDEIKAVIWRVLGNNNDELDKADIQVCTWNVSGEVKSSEFLVKPFPIKKGADESRYLRRQVLDARQNQILIYSTKGINLFDQSTGKPTYQTLLSREDILRRVGLDTGKEIHHSYIDGEGVSDALWFHGDSEQPGATPGEKLRPSLLLALCYLDFRLEDQLKRIHFWIPVKYDSKQNVTIVAAPKDRASLDDNEKMLKNYAGLPTDVATGGEHSRTKRFQSEIKSMTDHLFGSPNPSEKEPKTTGVSCLSPLSSQDPAYVLRVTQGTDEKGESEEGSLELFSINSGIDPRTAPNEFIKSLQLKREAQTRRRVSPPISLVSVIPLSKSRESMARHAVAFVTGDNTYREWVLEQSQRDTAWRTVREMRFGSASFSRNIGGVLCSDDVGLHQIRPFLTSEGLPSWTYELKGSSAPVFSKLQWPEDISPQNTPIYNRQANFSEDGQLLIIPAQSKDGGLRGVAMWSFERHPVSAGRILWSPDATFDRNNPIISTAINNSETGFQAAWSHGGDRIYFHDSTRQRDSSPSVGSQVTVYKLSPKEKGKTVLSDSKGQLLSNQENKNPFTSKKWRVLKIVDNFILAGDQEGQLIRFEKKPANDSAIMSVVAECEEPVIELGAEPKTSLEGVSTTVTSTPFSSTNTPTNVVSKMKVVDILVSSAKQPKEVFVVKANGKVYQWDLQKNSLKEAADFAKEIESATLLRDKDLSPKILFIAAAGTDGSVDFRELSSSGVKVPSSFTLSNKDMALRLASVPNGKYLFAGTATGRTRLWFDSLSNLGPMATVDLYPTPPTKGGRKTEVRAIHASNGSASILLTQTPEEKKDDAPNAGTSNKDSSRKSKNLPKKDANPPQGPQPPDSGRVFYLIRQALPSNQ